MKNLFLLLLVKWTRFVLAKKVSFGSSVTFGPLVKVSNDAKKDAISLGQHTSFYGRIINGHTGKISIGQHTTVRFNTLIECALEVDIGNEVIISNNVTISDTNSHPVDVAARSLMSRSDHEGELWSWEHAENARVEIQDNVWIGRNVLILKGVVIGKGSIVASGTVVTKNIPPYSLCFGNPCVIKDGKYRKDHE